MLRVPVDHQEEVNSLLLDLALDDVVSVKVEGAFLLLSFPVYGDECSMVDALDFSTLPYNRVKNRR